MTVTLPRPGEVGPGLPETPYVGLVPYAEGDAPFFFGRERERKIVTANLRAARLTLLYGPSGVGKTSLLRAGVVSSLSELAGPGLAVAVFSSWSDDPLPALTETIRRAVSDALDEEVEGPSPEEPLVETLGGWTQQVRRILVVLDQFEDYFLYHPDEDGDGTFFAEFPRLVNEPNLRVNFLLSIREDALAKLDRFEGRIPNLFGNYIRVDHLTRGDAREAVEGPIAEFNRRQAEAAEPYAIEPALVDAVVEAAASGRLAIAAAGNGALGDEAASGKVETPFLQLVMERLWRATVAAGSNRLTMQTLGELGGAQQIVENHLLEALGSLDRAEQGAAADLFRFLVSRSRTKIAHSASDLAEWTRRPEPEVSAVLEKLCRGESGRLLRAIPPPAGAPQALRYELFHDVLGEPIFEWRRRYEAERRRRASIRRFAVVAGVLLALMAAFAALGIWALVQRGHADEATRAASSLALASAANSQLAAHPDVSLLLGLEAVRAKPTPQARGSMISALEAARRTRIQAILRSRAGPLFRVVFSPDGRTLAATGRYGAVQLWARRSRRLVAVLSGRTTPGGCATTVTTCHSAFGLGVAISPDGQTLASAGRDGTVRLWNTRNYRQVAVLHRFGGISGNAEFAVTSLAFSPDGRRLVGGDILGGLEVWDTGSHRLLTPLVGDTSAVNGVAISTDGKMLASASDSGIVRLRSMSNYRQLAVLPGHYLPVKAVAFSPDGRMLASASADGLVRLWSISRHRQLAVLRGHFSSVNGLAFSPDRKTLASAGHDGTVRLWNTRNYRQVAVLHGHRGSVNGVAFSPDGQTLASVGADQTVRIWDPHSYQRRSVIRSHSGFVNGVAWSPDEKALASADDDGTVRLWDVRSHDPLAVLRGHTGAVFSVAFSPDRKTLASAGDDATVRLWNTRNQQQLAVLHGYTGAVKAVAFSPDGQTLASAGDDSNVRLWDLRSHRQLAVLRGHIGSVFGVAFSPDGQTLATAGFDVRLWNTRTHQQLAVLHGHTGFVLGVAFAPSGKTLASAGQDGTVRLWNTRNYRQLAVLHGHRGSVNGVAFSRDGQTLASAGSDRTVRLWDARSYQQLAVLRGHSSFVNGVAFNADGRTLASGSSDRTVRLWQGLLWRDTADLRRQVCRLVVGNLTKDEWQQLAPGLPYRASCPS